MKSIILSILALYQRYVRGFFSPCCRFYPTCSEYTKEAVGKYGVFKGIYKAGKRILRCNGFCQGGYDPLD